MSEKELLAQAEEFEANFKTFKSTSDKIIASKKAKELILSINELYKESKKTELMDVMKRLTTLKQKLDKKANPKIRI